MAVILAAAPAAALARAVRAGGALPPHHRPLTTTSTTTCRSEGIVMAARNAFVFALVLLTLAPSLPAGAVPVPDLRGIHLDSRFGRSAPRRDCAREPRITVDPTGIVFINS